MIDKVKETIKKYNMIQNGDNVIIGVSGGADSTALLHYLFSIKDKYSLKLIVVHINHGIRGIEAKSDEKFVTDLCRSMGVDVLTAEYDIKKEAIRLGVGEEEAGRIVRYKEFDKAFKNNNGNKIAVAHNKNDQVETLLMRMCRGTGLKGLTGIAPVRNHIIRPFIRCSREEVEQYCIDNNLKFRTDSTNLLDIYTRNKIRLKLIPWLKEELNENVIDNIARTAELLYEEEYYIEKESKKMFANCCVKKENNQVYLSLKEMNKLELAAKRRIIRLAYRSINKNIKDISFKHVNDTIDLMEKETGKSINIASGLKAEIEYDYLKLYSEKLGNNDGFCYNIKVGETIFIKEIGKYVRLSCNEEKNLIKTSSICTKAFDYDKMENDMQIRTRKTGDKLYLKGINGLKKLKDYFIDEKIPRYERNNIPLVACGDDIVWVIGHRVSDFYFAGKDTKKLLFIQIWEDV